MEKIHIDVPDRTPVEVGVISGDSNADSSQDIALYFGAFTRDPEMLNRQNSLVMKTAQSLAETTSGDIILPNLNGLNIRNSAPHIAAVQDVFSEEHGRPPVLYSHSAGTQEVCSAGRSIEATTIISVNGIIGSTLPDLGRAIKRHPIEATLRVIAGTLTARPHIAFMGKKFPREILTSDEALIEELRSLYIKQPQNFIDYLTFFLPLNVDGLEKHDFNLVISQEDKLITPHPDNIKKLQATEYIIEGGHYPNWSGLEGLLEVTEQILARTESQIRK